ncbi:MAG: hypothetical protein R2864_12330 [Syntrophotaleaceae bacterium]
MTKKPSKKQQKSTFGRRLGGLLLWSLLFVLMLAAADQALLRLTPQSSLLVELQDCYRDLRSRLLGGPRQQDSIEALLKEPEASAQSYFYADHQGELHFVDSLQQVPPAYRNQAQLLAE